MTRFARAKGSKSSNEKTPEDSTPWEVMKEQLLQSKKEKEEAGKRKEAEDQRIANYENFLKEHKVSKRKATWCDFPEEQPKKRLLPDKQPKASNKKQQTGVNVESTEDNIAKKKKKKKNKTSNTKPSGPIQNADQVQSEEGGSQNEQTGVNAESTEDNIAKKKKKKKNKTSKAKPSEPIQNADQVQSEEGGSQNAIKQKKKNKKKQKVANTTENTPQIENTQKSNIDEAKTFPNKHHLNSNNFNAPNNNMNKKKKTKGKPVRRKEINDNSFQFIINGKEVELIRFDGFPIMKKDAERLAELKQSMIRKGIPKSEVQRTMKLERRRAEKALARIKREVCYNCRKGGHNLSDCPELKSKIPGGDVADGVCFKCGSTEHRQFECKVQRDKEFRFATCFICRQPGHIARQCPDNPKGLYPNGGSCKLCGDVTHLRKDCPTTQTQREETSVKLDTLESTDNIEDIGHQVKLATSTESAKKPKKIKF